MMILIRTNRNPNGAAYTTGDIKSDGVWQFVVLNLPLAKCSRIPQTWMLTPQITNNVYKASWILLYYATKKSQQ